MSYTYQKNITNNFPNQRVDTEALQDELEGAGLSSATVEYIVADYGDNICEIVFDIEPSSGDKSVIDAIVSVHEGIPDPSTLRPNGGLVVSSLSTPPPPTVEVIGTSGTTTWGYKITAFSETGETVTSQETQVTGGNNNLDSNNYNKISWNSNPSAIKYGVYRTTADGTPSSVGLIRVTTLNYLYDKGRVASGAEPSTNTSGKIKFNSLSNGLVTSDSQGNVTSANTLNEISSFISDGDLDDSSGPRTDEDAIHKNISGEIDNISEKTSPSGSDVVLIEDSQDSNTKKKVQISNLPAASGGLPSATQVGQMLYSYNGATFSLVKTVVTLDGFIVTDDDGNIVVVE